MKSITILLSFLFATLFYMNAEAQPAPDDSVDTIKTNPVNDAAINAVTADVSSLQKQVTAISDSAKATKVRLDSLSSQIAADSAAKAQIDSSFSQALAYAKQHPETLYKPTGAHKAMSFFAFVFLILFLAGSIYYAVNSALLRDEGYMDVNGTPVLKPYTDCTFSYSRTQLYWWTLIITGCYVIFFALYDTLLPLNSTAVILIGSSLTTYIFGRTIDNGQLKKSNTDPPKRHQDVYAPAGFLNDILSDETGISIHRLQAVAFNIIYGLGYISYFFSGISDRKYPLVDFEQWQFVLLGISSVGYIGMKATENGAQSLPQRALAAMDNPPGVLPPDKAVNQQQEAADNAEAAGGTATEQRDITRF